MPDRIDASQPMEGMMIHYHRDGVNDWVLIVERIRGNNVHWLWKDGISTLEQANRNREWNEERYGMEHWVDFMVNPNNKWGNTSIRVLTSMKEPSWEV